MWKWVGCASGGQLGRWEDCGPRGQQGGGEGVQEIRKREQSGQSGGRLLGSTLKLGLPGRGEEEEGWQGVKRGWESPWDAGCVWAGCSHVLPGFSHDAGLGAPLSHRGHDEEPTDRPPQDDFSQGLGSLCPEAPIFILGPPLALPLSLGWIWTKF